MTPKERYLACLAGEPVDRVPATPIFMAWAAHRIGKSYRDLYLHHEVLVAAHSELAGTFAIDQVSSISDPWREASGYGVQIDYPEDAVGHATRYLFEEELDPELLLPFDPRASERCRDRIEAVEGLSARWGSTHSVLGWVEGPFAEFVDLRGMEPAMMDLYEDPDTYRHCAEILVRKAIQFAEAQIEAGADTIGIGDAAASLLGGDLYEEFVLPYEQALIAGIHSAEAKVKLHICGDTRSLLRGMKETGADVIDLDYPVPLLMARDILGPHQVIAGNFDPVRELRFASPEVTSAAAERCIREGGPARFILQPGCEVPPETPEENLRAFLPPPEGLAV